MIFGTGVWFIWVPILSFYKCWKYLNLTASSSNFSWDFPKWAEENETDYACNNVYNGGGEWADAKAATVVLVFKCRV